MVRWSLTALSQKGDIMPWLHELYCVGPGRETHGNIRNKK